MAAVAMLVVCGLLGGCSGGVQLYNDVAQQMYLNPSGMGVFDPNRLPAKAQPYKQWIMEAGMVCEDVRPEIVAGVIDVESAWDPRANEGKTGVGLGMAQFTTATWQAHGVDADGDGRADIFNGADAILSAAHYLCHIAELVRGYLRDGLIPNLEGPGSVRDLMIVGYNKGAYIWLPPHEWRGTPINYDSNGIPDATHSDGMTGQEYLRRVNAAINRFRAPGSGGAVAGGVREQMVAAAYAQVGIREDPKGSNCTKFSEPDGCIPWCAAFVSWIWNIGGFKYKTNWAMNFYSWGKANGSYSTDFSKAEPGDAYIYDNPPGQSDHVGLIVEVHSNGTIETVEGNTSNMVTHKGPFDPRTGTGIGYTKPIPGK